MEPRLYAAAERSRPPRLVCVGSRVCFCHAFTSAHRAAHDGQQEKWRRTPPAVCACEARAVAPSRRSESTLLPNSVVMRPGGCVRVRWERVRRRPGWRRRALLSPRAILAWGYTTHGEARFVLASWAAVVQANARSKRSLDSQQPSSRRRSTAPPATATGGQRRQRVLQLGPYHGLWIIDY